MICTGGRHVFGPRTFPDCTCGATTYVRPDVEPELPEPDLPALGDDLAPKPGLLRRVRDLFRA
jgi:hypothetical protein